MIFCWTARVLKENKHTISEWMERKKPISELTVNTQRIGVTLKLETIKNFVSLRSKKEFYWCTLFHFISGNEIIHILVYFIETRLAQLGLEQYSAKYLNATKEGRTLNYP